MGFIYCLQSPSGKKYVGMTESSVSERFASHVRDAHCHASSAIHHAINKYGGDYFTVTILDESDCRDELCAKEAFWIAELNTLSPHGYNLKGGGESGYKFTDEAKQRVSEGVRKAQAVLGYKEKQSAASKRVWKDPDRLAKHAQQMRAYWAVEGHKQKHSEVMREHWEDGSRAAAYSERMLTTWEDDAYREKVIRGLRRSAPCVQAEGVLYDCASHAAEELGIPTYTVIYRVHSKLNKWKGWHNVRHEGLEPKR